MRLFTAIDPTPEVHVNLVRLLERLRPAARLRWTRPDNLHLTLKFIGEYPEANLGALDEALRGVAWPPPFDVRIGGLGFFPDERRPRVFWVGISAGPELGELATRIDQALVRLGVPAERRPYSPHLTLARIEDRTPLERLYTATKALDSLEFGAFRPDRFHLYRSQPSPGGAVYTQMGEFRTTF